MTPEQLSNILEQYIDRASLGSVIEILAGICNEKADHLRTNWQDNVQAKAWETDAEKLANLEFVNPSEDFWSEHDIRIPLIEIKSRNHEETTTFYWNGLEVITNSKEAFPMPRVPRDIDEAHQILHEMFANLGPEVINLYTSTQG